MKCLQSRTLIIFISLLLLITNRPEKIFANYSILKNEGNDGKTKNSLIDNNLHGKIKSIESFVYFAKSETKKGKMWGSSFTAYDENGNKTEWIKYNADKSIDSKESYKFSENGILENKIEYDADGVPVKVFKLEFDSENNQYIETTAYALTGSIIKRVIYKVDSKGNRTEDVSYNSDGSIAYKNKYLHDENGNCYEQCYYAEDTTVFLNKFDERGNEIEYRSLKANGSIKFINFSKYTYDSNGNILEKYLSKDGKNFEIFVTYKYNSKGIRIETNSYDFGKLHNTYIYDENDNVLESIQYGNYPSKTLNKYIFDAEGNWIKMVDFENGKADRIYERIIVYY